MLCFVYAYDMIEVARTGTWCLLLCHRIISYHDDFLEASWEVTRLINEDQTNPNECFAVGAIPLSTIHEHNLF